MSILARTVTNSSLSLKFNSGFNHVFRLTRSLQSTSTDSTPETMELDSENQEEDQGYDF
jgi:hypothetical protein